MTETSATAVVDIAQRPNGALRRRRGGMNDPRFLLSWGLIVVLALLVLPPVFFLLRGSLAQVGIDGSVVRWTFDYYRAIFSDARLLVSLQNSLVFATLSALMSLLVGGSLAWVVERTNAPFRSLAYVVTIISMGMPFVLIVAAWLFLLGPVGPFNQIYKLLTGSTQNLFDVYSLWGMIVIEGFHWSPLAFLLLASTFKTANADMEEAARMSGASVFYTIRKISLKLATPAILAVTILTFIRAIEAFEVPALVGMPGRVSVLTTEIFHSARSVPQDFGTASAFSVVLLLFVGVLFSFYSKLSRNADRYASVTGKGFRPRPLDLGAGRWIAGGFVVLMFVLLVVLPILALCWIALTPYFQPITLNGFFRLSLGNFQTVLGNSYYITYALNTLLVALGAATFVMAMTVIAAWIAARRGPGAWLLDQLTMTPFIFPGIVLGVAMMQIYLRVPIPIYGTLWIILLAFTIKNLPYGMRYCYTGILQIHRELEEAAAMSGAGNFMTLRRVIAPLLAPALLGGWLFIFLICTRELSIAILLTSPRSQLLSIAMYDLLSGDIGELAALGLAWTLAMTIVAVIFHVWSSRRNRATIMH